MSAQMGEAQPSTTPDLSSDQIRGRTFDRAPLGRRGFDEQEVQQFVELASDELATREREIEHLAEETERLADENRRLKHAMREWHRQQMGFDSAELMARTQQEIEDQIAQAERYSREREEDATRRYDAIIAEARQHAQEELAASTNLPAAARPTGEPAGGPGSERQLAHVRGLLQALDGLAAHVDAAREAFASEVQVVADGDSEESPSEHTTP
jgi:DivIVA domain-containing protein